MQAHYEAVMNKTIEHEVSDVANEPSEIEWKDMAMLKDPRSNAQNVTHFADIVENIPAEDVVMHYQKVKECLTALSEGGSPRLS